MRKVFDLIRKVAPTQSNVLLTGESGTGKEVVSRAIHAHSPRAPKRFVAVSCHGLVDSLIESELFGYVKGAFTGAAKDKPGLFEAAEGGTLFLDEIGTMPLPAQAKLLRALQDKEVMPVGSTQTRSVDVRIIAASNRPLEELIAEGLFREDLYYRLNVVEIVLPPLRERREDISALVAHFIRKLGREMNKPVKGIEPEALRALIRHEWKGNVRELENVIERGLILVDGDMLTLRDLPASITGAAEEAGAREETADLKEYLKRCERRHILAVVQEAKGDKNEAAEKLGIGLSSLYRKMDELDIDLAAGEPAKETSDDGS
jgi:transcriptional regulator with PAS, ATPase and Fis domain